MKCLYKKQDSNLGIMTNKIAVSCPIINFYILSFLVVKIVLLSKLMSIKLDSFWLLESLSLKGLKGLTWSSTLFILLTFNCLNNSNKSNLSLGSLGEFSCTKKIGREIHNTITLISLSMFPHLSYTKNLMKYNTSSGSLSSTFFPFVNTFSSFGLAGISSTTRSGYRSTYSSSFRLAGGIFIQKRWVSRNALIKKTLILDDVLPNSYYLKELQKLYGKTLGEYLAKYLTYFANNKPSENLDEFPGGDYDDKYLRTFGDFGSFGGFLNQEILEMNDLPTPRRTIAKITIYGENLYLKKINHFFDLLDFFSMSALTLNFNCQVPDNPLNAQGRLNNFYIFPEWPNKTLSYHAYGYRSRVDVGFFHINFKETFNVGEVSDYENFLNILKTSNLTINFGNEELLQQFTKALIEIKSRLFLLKLNSEESPCSIPLDLLIYYVDSLLNIVKRQLKFRKKVITNLIFVKKLPLLAKILINKFLRPKINFFSQNKFLVLPFISFLILFLYLRIYYYQFVFFCCTIVFLFVFLRRKPERAFPTKKAWLFDFKENFLSRITLIFFLRFFLFIRVVSSIFWLNLSLGFFINWFFPSLDAGKYYLCYLTESEIIIVVSKALTLASKNLDQKWILSVFESLQIIKKSSILGSKTIKETNQLQTFYLSALVNDFNNNYGSSGENSVLTRYVSERKIDDSLAVLFPHLNRNQKFLMPAEMFSENYNVYSLALTSETMLNWICAYNQNLSKINLTPRVVFQWSDFTKKLTHLQGDFVFGHVWGDIKSVLEHKLLFGKHYIFEKMNKSGYFKEIREILENNPKNKYLMILDVTHIDFTESFEKQVLADLAKIIKKYPIFGSFENPRLVLEFFRRIPGFKDNLILTPLMDFIVNNKKIIEIVTEYNSIVQATFNEVPNKDIKLVSKILAEKLEDKKFYPQRDISNILNEFFINPTALVLKKPIDLIPAKTFIIQERKDLPKIAENMSIEDFCVNLQKGDRALNADILKHYSTVIGDDIYTKGAYELQKEKWSNPKPKPEVGEKWQTSEKGKAKAKAKIQELLEKTPYKEKK